ncbi:MAG: hypothetical protein ACE5FT_04680 [Candidatus Nanoarchaeia archaeon]
MRFATVCALAASLFASGCKEVKTDYVGRMSTYEGSSLEECKDYLESTDSYYECMTGISVLESIRTPDGNISPMEASITPPEDNPYDALREQLKPAYHE